MKLPLTIPYLPMEAENVDDIPQGKEWQYEPKWDGFRCVAFRNGDDVQLQSKAGKPLTRYFPEIAATLSRLRASQFVLDGELVVPIGDKLSFEELLMRIHPAATRIRKLSQEHPAQYIVFDLLVNERGESLADLPLSGRRPKLESFARRYFGKADMIRLSPATHDLDTAHGWFRAVGAGLDGIIAKRRDMPYASGLRTGMVKIKRIRTADCVVGGFRYASTGKLVGSLLLGLYDDEGLLNHVGFTSGIKASERKELTRKLEPLIKPPGFTGNAPGGPSRWSTERSTHWQPLAPELVVEIQYDHFSGGRFRHGTRLCRWRPDKDPTQCTFDQVAPHSRSPLALL